jgi:hypothetical protein
MEAVMIQAAPVLTVRELDQFYNIRRQIYKNINQDRGGNEELVSFLLNKANYFKTHARVLPFLLLQEKRVVGRFVLIHDKYLKDYVQVAFFEALPLNEPLCDIISACSEETFPGVPKMLVGVAGHLNHGAGILLNHFDEPPIYNFAYNPSYYSGYFSGLKAQQLFSFRLPLSVSMTSPFFAAPSAEIKEINVRCLDKSRFKEELELYTALNNRNFFNHPYWSVRRIQDDYEVFTKLEPLLEPENLLFAEKDGRTVGFLLWTPDFNEWWDKQHGLDKRQLAGLKRKRDTHVIRYMEIGVDWDQRNGKVTAALLFAFVNILKHYNSQEIEGGFIMERNPDSLNLARCCIKRITGKNPEPYRRWAVYEGTLARCVV